MRYFEKIFHFEETISNINIGIVERICDPFISALFLQQGFFVKLFFPIS